MQNECYFASHSPHAATAVSSICEMGRQNTMPAISWLFGGQRRQKPRGRCINRVCAWAPKSTNGLVVAVPEAAWFPGFWRAADRFMTIAEGMIAKNRNSKSKIALFDFWCVLEQVISNVRILPVQNRGFRFRAWSLVLVRSLGNCRHA